MNLITEMDQLIENAKGSHIRNIKRDEENKLNAALKKIDKLPRTDWYLLAVSLYQLSAAHYSLSSILEKIYSYFQLGYQFGEDFIYWEVESKSTFSEAIQSKLKELKGLKAFEMHISKKESPEADLSEFTEHLINTDLLLLSLLSDYNNAATHSSILSNQLSRFKEKDIVGIRNLISIDRLTHITEENEEVLADVKEAVKDWYQNSNHNFLERTNGYHHLTYVKFYRYILTDAQLTQLKAEFLNEIQNRFTEVKDKAWETAPSEIISTVKYLKEQAELVSSFI